MTADPITRLNAALEGRYRIERELGAGGMATVYLARDQKHNRNVALKVLKPELAAVVGAERFLAEIETTANLQHPHILPLFDSGEADSFLFYVMPYVEGESLRERLDRERQLPVEDAVQIAANVAEALDYAHSHGVIHRDIKPANILLQAGKPVVSDFGIALAVGVAGGGRLTETGLSLGTPHYMSPEQATGDLSVGAASDVYALGCVLYEMLVGEPPYTGSTPQAILGRIITGDVPPVRAERKSVPEHVEGVIARALEKVPADRFPSASELGRALADPAFRHGVAAGGARSPLERTGGRVALAASAVVAASVIVAVWALLRPPPPLPVTRQALDAMAWVGEAPPLDFGRGAVAPDGSSIVLPVPTGTDVQLAIKTRDALDPVPIPGTEGARDVAYAPDGQSIAYAIGSELFVRPLLGGSARRIADDTRSLPSQVAALTWLDDGTILYERVSDGGSIARVQPDGTEGNIVSADVGGVSWLWGLPGADAALVVVETDLYALDLEEGSAEVLLEEVEKAWYAPSGHLVYLDPDGAVVGVAFDATARRLRGGPVRLFEAGESLHGNVIFGPSGTMLHLDGQPDFSAFEPVWVDRNGSVRLVDPGWTVSGNTAYSSLALSPDDGRLAISMPRVPDRSVAQAGGWGLWVKQLDNGPLQLVTSEGNVNRRPTWSPDGQRLTYVHDRSGGGYEIRRIRPDGTGDVETLLDSRVAGGWLNEAVITPDGEWLLYRLGSTTNFGNPDIYMMRLGVDSVGVPLLASSAVEWSIALSPDGEWLAFVSDETGSQEVFVQPFPDVGAGKRQVSRSGGAAPRWAHSGRELFYRNGEDQMVVVSVSTDGGLAVGEERVLFSLERYNVEGIGHAMYDVSSDDQRFVALRSQGAGRRRVVLIENFLEELAARVGDG